MGKGTKGNEHTHDIEFVQFVPGNHIHGYSTPTTVNDGHYHVVRGYTSGVIPSGRGHVHYYEGVTTFADGHVHHFSGYTGPAVVRPDGTHYHLFGGQTSMENGHIHAYQGQTSIERS